MVCYDTRFLLHRVEIGRSISPSLWNCSACIIVRVYRVVFSDIDEKRWAICEGSCVGSCWKEMHVFERFGPDFLDRLKRNDYGMYFWTDVFKLGSFMYISTFHVSKIYAVFSIITSENDLSLFVYIEYKSSPLRNNKNRPKWDSNTPTKCRRTELNEVPFATNWILCMI